MFVLATKAEGMREVGHRAGVQGRCQGIGELKHCLKRVYHMLMYIVVRVQSAQAALHGI